MLKIKKLGLLLGILTLALAMLTACGGGGGNETAPAPAPTEQPSADEGGAGDSDLIAVGEEQVQKSCIGCHGTDLQGGMGGAAPSLHGTNLSKEELIDILVNGRGAMPGGTANGNEEAVAEYILSLQ